MTSNSKNIDPRWRLPGQLARKHRFTPLFQDSTTEADSSWQDYQQAFNTGYEEGLTKGHAEGFESGSEEGLRSGHASGFNQGKIEGILKGRETIDNQLNQLIVPLSALKSTLEEGHNQQIMAQQQLILDLVRRVALQVIRCELTLQPQQILSLVEETIAALPDSKSEMIIHLEPNAVDRLKELAADKVRNWTLIADPTISPGGCRIISDSSDADASVETRLNACMDQVQEKLNDASPRLNDELAPPVEIDGLTDNDSAQSRKAD